MANREEEKRGLRDPRHPLLLAQRVLENESLYPPELAYLAARVLWNSTSREEQDSFMAAYDQAPLVRKALNIPYGLPYPPTESEYYEPHELTLPGVEIGTEPTHGYTMNLFPEQLRRHCVVCGMTGSGKTNLLLIIAKGIAELETKGKTR